MGYLAVSIIAAMAMSVSVYNETSSMLLTFLAYSLTGTMVLVSVILSDILNNRGENQFKTTE